MSDQANELDHNNHFLIQENEKYPEFGYCLVDSVESILTEISGQQIVLSDEEKRLRTVQMETAVELVNKRLDLLPDPGENLLDRLVFRKKRNQLLSRVKPTGIRMDLIAMKKFIEGLKKGETQSAEVLNSCEVRYARGGVEEIQQYLEQGWQVAVAAPFYNRNRTDIMMHIFHIGRNEQGNLLDLSDTERVNNLAMSEVVDKAIKNGEFEEALAAIQTRIRGENIILVRKK